MYICPICGNVEFTEITDKKHIRFNCFGEDKKIVKCTCCKSTQLYPQWTDKELEKLYFNYSKKKDFKGQIVKKNISKYIEPHMHHMDDILEIGCGNGDNVKHYMQKYNVIGIDKDPTVCDGKSILNYDFEEYKGKKFDFIYGIHVFEHVKNPKKFIKHINNLLYTNGNFLLEIPNADDPLLSLYKNKAYFDFYWYPFHMFFYNKSSISFLFSKIGMDVKIELHQRYHLLNHLNWIIFGKPSNFNIFIPIIDNIYSFVLTKIFRVSDTLIIYCNKY